MLVIKNFDHCFVLLNVFCVMGLKKVDFQKAHKKNANPCNAVLA